MYYSMISIQCYYLVSEGRQSKMNALLHAHLAIHTHRDGVDKNTYINKLAIATLILFEYLDRKDFVCYDFFFLF